MVATVTQGVLPPSYTVLAIDPSPVRTGFVLWDGQTILAKGLIPPGNMLRDMLNYAPDCDFLAVERVRSYGSRAVGNETLDTCELAARLDQKWVDLVGKPSCLIPRNDVRRYVVGSARANDSKIRQAIISRLGDPGTKKTPGVTYGCSYDIWAALAVALTARDLLVFSLLPTAETLSNKKTKRKPFTWLPALTQEFL